MTLLKITNEPMQYAWGSSDLLADLLGIPTPEHSIAEVWFGTHSTSPAKILDAQNGTLRGRVGELDYLVKFLSAATPLSIQAHPSKERASKQFASGHKSYSDQNHKPEIIIAVTPFKALCGFRPKAETEMDLRKLAEASIHLAGLWSAFTSAGYQAAMNWIYETKDGVVGQLVAHSTVLDRKRSRLLEALYDQFPEDRGILVALLMNQVTLSPGEALFLPAGNIHAYLEGLGVEAMAASDNVLRGGLTPKPVDVKELLQVLDYSELENPRVQTKKLSTGITSYPVSVDDFQAYRIEASPNSLVIDVPLPGTGIMVCISGSLEISTSKDETLHLKRGEAAFLAEARLFSVAGSGTGYLVTGS